MGYVLPLIYIVGSLVIGIVMYKSNKTELVYPFYLSLFFDLVYIALSADSDNGFHPNSPWHLVFFFLFVIPIIAMYVHEKNKAIKYAMLDKELAEKQSKMVGGTMLDRFFVECVLADSNDLTKPKNKQRAQLLADKFNLKYPNGIEELYQQALNEHKVITHNLFLKCLENKKIEEQKEFEQLNKYSDLIGKDKRIAMLKDRASELRKQKNEYKQYSELLVRSSQQEEKDWALLGGIADGIAGPGAGVATAVDIQLKNNQIRAENKKRLQSLTPALMTLGNLEFNNKKNADDIMKEIESFKLKLVSDEPAAELMKKISFSNTDVSVSETGAAIVSTSASLSSNFRIFDDVPAIVDGTIFAKIYDGAKLRGTAQLVLPLYGLGENIPLKGICIDCCCSPDKTYKVQFIAKNLWAMEK